MEYTGTPSPSGTTRKFFNNNKKDKGSMIVNLAKPVCQNKCTVQKATLTLMFVHQN